MIVKDDLEGLLQILDGGTSMCYCKLCRHSPDFGHRYFCPCGPEPQLDAEAAKIERALEHARALMRQMIEQKK